MLFRYHFHFADCNLRNVAEEQQDPGRKHPECSDKKANFNPSWVISRPTGRQIILRQRSDHNIKSFVPHSEVDQQRNGKHNPYTAADFLRPEQLRQQSIQDKHCPELEGIVAGDPVFEERVHFVF